MIHRQQRIQSQVDKQCVCSKLGSFLSHLLYPTAPGVDRGARSGSSDRLMAGSDLPGNTKLEPFFGICFCNHFSEQHWYGCPGPMGPRLLESGWRWPRHLPLHCV